MKILMIGGTRFFGKRSVQLMLDQGHSLTLLTRGQNKDNFGNKVARLVADRTDKEQLKNVINNDYDIVVDNMLMNAQESNDAISVLRDRIGHYVMTSTVSVYDPQPGAIHENNFEASKNIPRPASHPGETYQQGKRAAEHALTHAPFGVSIIRIPVIVGPDDYTQRLLTHVTAVKENTKLYFPNPDARFSFLHSQDAARALSWLCTDKPHGVFNVSAPNAWTLRDLMGSIEQIVGKKFIFGGMDDTPSPFGIAEDYFMNVERAQIKGFQVAKLEEWLPKLIEELGLGIKT